MRTVVLLDVDNTLIDNDAARAQLWSGTDRVLGLERSKKFWSVYEDVRHTRGYVDFLETLARYHASDAAAPPALDRVILDLSYAEFRFREAIDVIDALWAAGATPVVLSDGDPVFQPLKIARAGISQAVHGNVLVFAHKEARLDDVARLFPADRYVAVDDKADVLARIKAQWSERVRTVHVLQGKYADDPYDGPRPDVVLTGIAGLAGTAANARLFDDAATSLAAPSAQEGDK